MAKKELKNSKDKTSFLKGFKAELKKVVWPTPKQLFNNTVAVLTIVLITTLIVFILDFSFESLNKYGIDKIKEVVSNSIDENTTSNNEVQEDNSSVESEENTPSDENVSSESNETTEQ